MAYRKHDVQEARLHMMDVMEIGEKKFEAFPNDPNVDLVFSREDLAQLKRLIDVAEDYMDRRDAQVKDARKKLREQRRGEIT